MPSPLVDFSQELANTVERVGASVIALPEGGRSGVSGTVWREGIAIAVAHTIRGMDEVTVVDPSGAQAKVPVASRDTAADMAVLKVGPEARPAVPADDAQARAGEIVLSVGRLGSDGLAAAYGILSAIGGPWRTWTGARVDRWLSLDLNPFPGFSGGPIVNAAGEVLGMAISGRGRSAAVLPTSSVNRIVDQLLKHGRAVRGYIGVGVQPVAFPESARQVLGIGGRGLLITAIAPGTAAEDAKLALGDVIVAIDGKPLRTGSDLQWLLDSESVGKAISLGVVRGGRLQEVAVTVRDKAAS